MERLYFCAMFNQRIQKFIDTRKLLSPHDKILVALSGGADSVALLRVLHALDYSCECLHCNFHLRGEESDRDEHFVRSLCEGLGVQLHVKHFSTNEYAREKGISIEMAARELRYSWFEEMRGLRGAGVIAVAHHRDDSVETLILNLVRGTGVNGLKGISPKNNYVVRPLLQESRKSIEEYLHHLNQDYVTDSTNLEDEYMRNKIRLNVIPLLEEINPSVSKSIFETSQRLTEVAMIYSRDRQRTLEQLKDWKSESTFQVNISLILQDIAPTSLLHELVAPLGFNAGQEHDIFHCMENNQSGKVFHAPHWTLLRDREVLIFQKKDVADVVPQVHIEEKWLDDGFVIPRQKEIACIDADKVKGPLTIRRWEQGDKFAPLGMTGKKKVSDYLTDRKFTLFQKERQWVVCSGEDIVWLVNERSDHRYRVTENTRRVLILSIKVKDGE